MVVNIFLLPLPLRLNFGTLTINLGCFPFDFRPLRLMSVCYHKFFGIHSFVKSNDLDIALPPKNTINNTLLT